MKLIRNNHGFTLMELIITIGIVAIAIGMTSFGINIVFNSRVEAFASDFQSDLRDIKGRTLSTKDEAYKICWRYNSSKGYYYEIYSHDNKHIKTIYLNKNIIINEIDDAGNITRLTTDDDVLKTDFIEFDESDGSCTSGAGIYEFTSSASDDKYTVEIVDTTGGIFLEKE